MKRALMVAIIFGLITTYAGAGEPGGWSWGMYFAEVGAGEAFSLGMFGTGLAAAASSSHGNEEVAMAAGFALGTFVGSPTGVLLVGELAGAPSDNKFKTYGLTFASTLIYPGIMTGAFFASLNSVGYAPLAVAVIGFLSTPIINPFITAAVYNKVKRPKTESTASVNVRPYTSLIADNGAGPVPVYGVSVSF